jgi:hypothetical protein
LKPLLCKATKAAIQSRLLGAREDLLMDNKKPRLAARFIEKFNR